MEIGFSKTLFRLFFKGSAFLKMAFGTVTETSTTGKG